MLELGMTFSMQQLVIDNDIFSMVKKAMQGIPVSEETLAVESIQKVGVGNNFLALKQTRQLVDYPSCPMLIDRRIPLNSEGTPHRWGNVGANLAASSSLYLLHARRPPAG